MQSSTVKSLAAVVLTGAGSALVVGFQAAPSTVTTVDKATTGGAANTSAVVSGSTSTTTTSSSSSASASTSASSSSAATSSDAAGTGVAVAATYADGTWTGTAVDEPWGTFQVQAVVSGGQLTDVVIVSSPQDGHSGRINDQAVPALTQAAVASQGAEIDMISGATWTSRSYMTSLQAALDQAAAAADQAA